MLEETGTMAQSFHFQVTPEKAGEDCLGAQRGNCMLNIGYGQSTPGGSVQTDTIGCPKLKAYCCPKGMVGRPKKPLFKWGPVLSHPKPWPQCNRAEKANAQIPGVYYDPNLIEWTNSCRIKNWRPPVF